MSDHSMVAVATASTHTTSTSGYLSHIVLLTSIPNTGSFFPLVLLSPPLEEDSAFRNDVGGVSAVVPVCVAFGETAVVLRFLGPLVAVRGRRFLFIAGSFLPIRLVG